MSYVPPHLRKKVVAVAENPVKPEKPVKGVRFISNATGNTDVQENTGLRFSPKSNRSAVKKTLKHSKFVSPNKSPLHRPSSIIHELPPKFMKMIQEHLTQTKKTKKTRKHKHKKHTRKIHKHK